MGDRVDRATLHRNAEALLRRVGIGHNLGPPLDQSWQAWIWRRAVAAAWKTPPREIALSRLRRAEALGLSYREFTAVLMDRGASLNTVVMVLPGLIERRFRGLKLAQALKFDREAVAAIARLKAGELLVLARLDVSGRMLAQDDAQEFLAALNRRLDGKIAGLRVIDELAGRAAGQLRAWLKERGRGPGEAFMVGASFDDAELAEAAGLPLFKWCYEYFATNAAPPR